MGRRDEIREFARTCIECEYLIGFETLFGFCFHS